MDFSAWYWGPVVVVFVVANLAGGAALVTAVISTIARGSGREVERPFILRVFAIVFVIQILLILFWWVWLR